MASARIGDPAFLTCLLAVLLIGGCQAKGYTCSSDNPVLVWPLSFNTGISEIINNSSDGVKGKVTYENTPQAENTAISSATVFTGENMSYMILYVPYNTAFLEDFTIQFYAYFEDIVTGTILFYESEIQTESTSVQKFQIFVLNGSIVIDIPQYGSVEYAVDIRPQEWHHIMYERDISKEEVKLYVNRTALAEKTVNKLNDKPTIAPGSLYIGVNLNTSSYFIGRLACLQIIPCKLTTSLLYDNYCINVSSTYTLSPDSATTTFTTGLSISSTVSGTFTPSSTSKPSVARSSTLSSISSVVNKTPSVTRSSTLSSISTVVNTKPSVTTSSTLSSISTVVNTTPSVINLSTLSSINTVMNTTHSVTRSSTLSLISTTVNTPISHATTRIQQQSLSSEIHPVGAPSTPNRGFDVRNQCVHFTVKHQHTAFSNSTEVLDVTVVTDIASCAKHCNKFRDCSVFTVQFVPVGIICHIGTDQANLTAREELHWT